MASLTLSPAEEALVEIGRRLRAAGYAFTSVTPETHRRVLARPHDGESLRDVFGWSRPFTRLDPALVALLERAGMVIEDEHGRRSGVRFSTLDGGLYAHGAYPTVDPDAVFFGPDSHRFVRFLRARLDRAARLCDVGAGSGVGGLSLADRVERIVLADVNARALSLCRVNAALAGVLDRVEIVESDVLASVHGALDVVIANPPYLVDPGKRLYRDGGALGIELAVRIARDGIARARRVLLYSGAPILDGHDPLQAALAGLPVASYEELDPDVFGEELDEPAYAAVDRIAVAGVDLARP